MEWISLNPGAAIGVDIRMSVDSDLDSESDSDSESDTDPDEHRYSLHRLIHALGRASGAWRTVLDRRQERAGLAGPWFLMSRRIRAAVQRATPGLIVSDGISEILA